MLYRAHLSALRVLEELHSICQLVCVVVWVTFTSVGGLVVNNIEMGPWLRLSLSPHGSHLHLGLITACTPDAPPGAPDTQGMVTPKAIPAVMHL